ncbi:hypothetical protein DFJ73DRAFT_831246 [Zopfochytrium polystomum]|nr:hypothetical protein DFJ73DRAFT_831246 [Zopfochytrium polystomum]
MSSSPSAPGGLAPPATSVVTVKASFVRPSPAAPPRPSSSSRPAALVPVTRRFSVSSSSEGFNELSSAVRSLFAPQLASISKSHDVNSASLSIAYLDDEGDWIAMSSESEFSEAVRCSAGGVLKVLLSVSSVTKEQTAPPADNVDNPASSVQIPPNAGVSHTFASNESDLEKLSFLVPVVEEVIVETKIFETAVQERRVVGSEISTELRDGGDSKDEADGPRMLFACAEGELCRERSLCSEEPEGSQLDPNVNDSFDFDYHRVIIQTAIGEGIRSLLDVPRGHSTWEYAVNEILFGKAIIVSAVEEALRNGSSRTGPEPSHTETSSEAQQSWETRHRDALNSLKESIQSIASRARTIASSILASGIAKSIQDFARDIQEAWSQDSTVRSTALSESAIGEPSEPSSAYSSRPDRPSTLPSSPEIVEGSFSSDLRRSLNVVFTVVGVAVLAVGTVLSEVGSIMTEGDPLSKQLFDLDGQPQTVSEANEPEDDGDIFSDANEITTGNQFTTELSSVYSSSNFTEAPIGHSNECLSYPHSHNITEPARQAQLKVLTSSTPALLLERSSPSPASVESSEMGPPSISSSSSSVMILDMESVTGSLSPRIPEALPTPAAQENLPVATALGDVLDPIRVVTDSESESDMMSHEGLFSPIPTATTASEENYEFGNRERVAGKKAVDEEAFDDGESEDAFVLVKEEAEELNGSQSCVSASGGEDEDLALRSSTLIFPLM